MVLSLQRPRHLCIQKNFSRDACPIDDVARIAMVGEMRSVLHAITEQHRLGGSMYYTRQGQIHAAKEDHDSAFLCQALAQSGKLALSPM